MFACLANGCPEAARYLAERGAQLDLVTAAGVGRLDVVQRLVDQADIPRREMALRYAAAYANGDVVRCLLDRGLNVDAHTGDGETALFYTVLSGHLDVINLLLERGARPGVRTGYGGDMVGAALWRLGHGGDPDLYLKIIETLVAAGYERVAQVTTRRRWMPRWRATGAWPIRRSIGGASSRGRADHRQGRPYGSPASVATRKRSMRGQWARTSSYPSSISAFV